MGAFTKPLPGAIINPVHPLARGLVGCWLLGEGGGLRANDSSFGANPGTLNNFTGNPWVGSRRGGQALSFDGVNDYVKTAANTPLAATVPQNVTISARVRTGSGQNSFALIAGRTHSSTHTAPYYAFAIGANYSSDGKFYGQINNGNGVAGNIVRAFSYAQNTEYDVAYTYDSTTQTLYVNGNSVGTNLGVSGAIAYGSGGFVSIGANAGGGENFTGAVEGVRVYNRVLTASEVAWLYAEPYAAFSQNRSNVFNIPAAGGTALSRFYYDQHIARAA